MAVTMLEVANKAGVSKSTVSRVLNGKNIVRPELVSRVFEAIKETGYRPNILAQSLSSRQTNFIGFVIANVLFDGPYFSSLMYHAASFCEDSGHQLVMTDGKHSKVEERHAINFLLDMRCAGIIIYPKYLNEKELASIIASSDIPIMVINHKIEERPQYAITTDHYQSALKMMEYIVEQGHKQIAIIRGNVCSGTDKQRYQAYRDVLEKYHLPYQGNQEQQGNWTLKGGYLAAQRILETSPQITAVLACNDEMAIGASKAFKKAGLSLPEEMSVVGFDNSNVGEYLSPSLTSVDIPLKALTQKAILNILGEHEKAAAIDTSASIIFRESVHRMMTE
ncbi:LacI family transcriptional regulator [Vibrio cincinnatiensis]|jgi:LacI family asc operon transcriptional repressor|uniref:LacI family DNA-binding transcriptional regulator n=1 Tax=Vibrio cincinnatiensis TaxID=675 RepID=UPI0012AC936F|nr:LacI family DNA-binding transcriptional regulator [Vibrio cincinnatiensis]MCG3727316.1 LacI family transcriptional regulator [Vibrio cincinnatiensis]MCG3733569.1 LacI family transcriptional regulator [Vibrio cincinnatiensis]MCG3737464.1 LacI family transcriptional regulator [Vibrio cincinnatiensis]MCG3739398.1 LacI family transcriptional regulator [Vibrio cincinnatiensis]MCG3744879.1 LacI family transcriptional regulator [Vibrio cincinnatiensis]